MKLAVIGSGIAGLGAAWLLARTADVTVFECEGRLGGHSNTVEAPDGTAVDTGFIVFNTPNYPNLTGLFETLGVQTEASNMSFGVSMDGGGLEYFGSERPSELFAQRINLVRPRFWRMLRDLMRFYRTAGGVLDQPASADMSLGDYLAEHRYSTAFLEDHLLPIAAAIWSAPTAEILSFPVRTFVRFFENHKLLNVIDRLEWRTVTGGSRSYVNRIRDSFNGTFNLADGAAAVWRSDQGVHVRTQQGHEAVFDQVVMACHADQSLRLLTDADQAERSVLANFRYAPNRAILHQDVSLMPKRRKVWASWNYLGDRPANGSSQDGRSVSVTYWMNRLQNLTTPEPLLVTLNPLRAPAPEKVIAAFDYEHPIFDRAAIAAQAQIGDIQGRNRVWFCGAWSGYGFHEDGLASGCAVAEALGAQRPWAVTSEASTAFANCQPHEGARWRVAAE
jgi:uncharacterized protein